MEDYTLRVSTDWPEIYGEMLKRAELGSVSKDCRKMLANISEKVKRLGNEEVLARRNKLTVTRTIGELVTEINNDLTSMDHLLLIAIMTRGTNYGKT